MSNLKDIREIDTNMKELDSEKNLEVKWFKVDSKVIDNYMLGKGLKNGTFNRLDDSFVSDHVETLKKHTAGYSLEFRTASRFIKIQAKLAGPAYMAHMTAVGTIGFSLYVKKGKKWYFVSSSKINQAEYELDLIKDINKKPYTYRLYFPLYQALLDLKIGVEYDAPFEFVQDEMETMLVYGTSISQGGCATRPGMDYCSILGRLKNLNVINLGFSGSCKLEPAMLTIINQIIRERKVKYLLFEVEANSPSYEHFQERFTYFMEHLENKENLKIFLISHFDEAIVFINDKLRAYRKGFYQLQKKTAEKYGITFIDGTKLIKKMDCEGSVDGTHLTDLGFYEVAKQLAKIIK
ncbi:MAG TPA: SGNH/GDSL hydrolase family protein [Bacilli bacterium]|nr:hypothetical protein [Acholeplasmataceae bacterium]OQB61433.1 MAG: hypothetical protein BWX94_01317 [Tenericutes bacterium ADurb.Bin140]HOR95940.1 SGNH/GDSL hydrolase family protein [Bacilli bacterium]HPK58785.1 SGNH/GDSL hydrolase family protein [Bacilli bacterium]HRU49367.1 SGNH/GDSL hydrolase family protein [Bacilli bacterium]